MTIKAIETRYNGYRFRSRTEARWAVFFDAAGIRYEYEKEGYALPSGPYLPDFWLPDVEGGIWFEVKGETPSFEELQKAVHLSDITGSKVIIASGSVSEGGHSMMDFHKDGAGPIDSIFGWEYRNAFDAAKSARFEHGESGAMGAGNGALAHLNKWVPQLDLPKLTVEKAGGYRAMAFWRPDPQGRCISERDATVHISLAGIRDAEDCRTYTPVDLVMSAMGCTFEFAAEWLKTRLSAPTLKAAPDLPPASASPSSSIAAPRAKTDPFTPQNSGGLLEAISCWSLEYGRRPVPEFAMMAAIGFLSGLYGRRFVGPTGVGLNIYLVGLGASAIGKGHPLITLRTLAHDCGVAHLVSGGVPTSDSALERILRRTPTQVLPLDEFGLLLQSTNGRGATSWGASVRRALMELYSLSTDRWVGKQFSDPTRPDPSVIHCPTLTLMSVTTPTTFYAGLTEANLSDGFMNRLTAIHATGLPDRREAPAIMVTPPSLREAVKAALDDASKVMGFGGAAYRDPEQRPRLAAIPWADDKARQRWLEIEDWQIGLIEESAGHEGIVGRAAEQAQKLATIRALSRAGASASVTVDDVEWGYAIVQRSVDCLERGIAEYVTGSEFEALTKAILSAVRKVDSSGLSMSTLLRQRGVSKADTRTVNGALDRLVETGEVVRSGGIIRLAPANDNPKPTSLAA